MNKFQALSIFKEPNEEQLRELARLYFDLARGAFAIAVLQTVNSTISSTEILKILIAVLWGLVFMYLGLLSLKMKERVKK